MRRRFADALIVFVLVTLPGIGFYQACSGSGPTDPGNPHGPGGGAPPDNRAPIAVLSVVGPDEGPTPFTVKLDGSESNDPDGDEIEFLWMFSDGELATESIVSHEFVESGRHSAQLFVTDQWDVPDKTDPVIIYGWGLANSPWPKFAHDERNTGASPNRGPMMDLEHADEGGAFPRYWRSGIQTDKVTSVCVGYDGIVVYAQGPWLRARTADGGVLWDLEAEAEIATWPAILHDGSIIAGTSIGNLYRINADGEVIWRTDVSAAVGTPVDLFSAVNVDHFGDIYLTGYEITYADATVSWAVAVDGEGNMIWLNELGLTPENSHLNDDVYYKINPAITPDGDLIFNGKIGYRYDRTGVFKNHYEYIYSWMGQSGMLSKSQLLGSPSVTADGFVMFSHVDVPLFFPNGTFYMTMMEPKLDSEYWLDPTRYMQTFIYQAPVTSIDGISSTFASYDALYLTYRSNTGRVNQLKLTDYPDNLEGSSFPETTLFGSAADSDGNLYTSCLGLRAISPIYYQEVFQYGPKRYSLWTYARPSSHMTAPVIGDDGWLYVGYGNDILAIGD